MEINNKNVYEVIQSAMAKLKELENIDGLFILGFGLAFRTR